MNRTRRTTIRPLAAPSGLLASCAALLCLVAFALPGAAFAEDGESVLAKVDAALNGATDVQFDYDVVNTEPNGNQKAMTLRVWIKGEKRLTEFLAPGDMKGTKALVRARDTMFIYLPGYNKVRRVASHLTEGGFMGTTFSNDDMSTTVYGPFFSGKLLSETEIAWTVEATPKEGVKTSYGKLEMVISKEHSLPTEIRYFNDKGQHVKTEARSGFSCEGGFCNAAVMRMTDHTLKDAYTELIRTAWLVNPGLDEGLFSVRSLQP